MNVERSIAAILGLLGTVWMGLRFFIREERVFSDRAEAQIVRLEERLSSEQRRCDALERELWALKARLGFPPDEALGDHPPGDWPLPPPNH